MNTRPITNADLKVTKSPSWRDSKGRMRIHISLNGASFINHVYWKNESELADPATLEKIKIDLQTRLTLTVHKLARYIK